MIKEFAEHGTIVEKYDVARAESEVSAGIRFGLHDERDGLRLDERRLPGTAAGLQAGGGTAATSGERRTRRA